MWVMDRVLFPIWIFSYSVIELLLYICWKSICFICEGLFLSSVLFHWSMSLFLYQYRVVVVVELLSRVQLFCDYSLLASLSMGFPRNEYWSGLLFPSPGALPWLRDQTCISCINSQILHQCVSREAHINTMLS